MSNLYELGILAQEGDEDAFMEIVRQKQSLISYVSKNDEDCSQYILERLLRGIRKYKF